MVSRRCSSKDTVLDGNSNFLSFDSTVSGDQKGIKFRDIGQIPRNSLKFLPAKISSLKVATAIAKGIEGFSD